tara:strand:- start:24 stop:188 length:165 start_codon:yes stop_codon:yes gene_type:complete
MDADCSEYRAKPAIIVQLVPGLSHTALQPVFRTFSQVHKGLRNPYDEKVAQQSD